MAASHEIRWFGDNKEYSEVMAQDIEPYPWAYDEGLFLDFEFLVWR